GKGHQHAGLYGMPPRSNRFSRLQLLSRAEVGDSMRRLWIISLACGALAQTAEEDKTPVFGTTVVSTTGLAGQIYFIPNGSEILPNFKKLKPKGTIYTTRLNITPRSFTEGFPGVSRRIEWFAIQYTGKIWVENPGRYNFELTSDDGSKLHIDDKMV